MRRRKERRRGIAVAMAVEQFAMAIVVISRKVLAWFVTVKAEYRAVSFFWGEDVDGWIWIELFGVWIYREI